MTVTDTPRAWVGCLGCYNSGKLIGEWLDDADAIREYRCPEPVTIYDSHEELWVMDHENLPLIKGECSPVEFADAMDWLDNLEGRYVAAVVAWLDNLGLAWRDADIDEFDDAFTGEWSTEADFTYDLYVDTAGTREESEAIRDGVGLYAYVDWDRVARDLFMSDYWFVDSPDGVFVFRNT